MSYDYARLFDKLLQEVRKNSSPQARMQSVIAECESQRPHPDWEKFRKINFNEELSSLDTWLSNALDAANASDDFKGLWFGLYNPSYDGVCTAEIYVAASPKFVARGKDWACSSTFYPELGYLRSSVLEAIYRIAYDTKDGLGNDAEYPLVLAYGAIISRTALEQFVFKPPFSHLEGSAVGFDSGDFIFLGKFNNGEFVTDIQSG